jgi:hypothetical protein
MGPLSPLRRGQAISVICVGIFCLVINDAMAKWLTTYYSPLQIIFMRNLLALPMILVVVLSIGGAQALRTQSPAHSTPCAGCCWWAGPTPSSWG